VFDFASLQSALGRSILQRSGKDPEDLSTFYLLADYRSAAPRLLSKAAAALFVLNTLGWPWRAAGVFRVFPLSWLNRVYDLVARHRYRVFGRSETCFLPSAEHRRRFLDI
jgi:predicted DCC family thiol-disulfide oxidoreductase YuxK